MKRRLYQPRERTERCDRTRIWEYMEHTAPGVDRKIRTRNRVTEMYITNGQAYTGMYISNGLAYTGMYISNRLA